jgi:hypothetical protein
MDVEPLVASDLPPAPTEAAPVSAEIVAPSLPATGKKKKRDGAARNGRQPQAGAPHPGTRNRRMSATRSWRGPA